MAVFAGVARLRARAIAPHWVVGIVLRKYRRGKRNYYANQPLFELLARLG